MTHTLLRSLAVDTQSQQRQTALRCLEGLVIAQMTPLELLQALSPGLAVPVT